MKSCSSLFNVKRNKLFAFLEASKETVSICQYLNFFRLIIQKHVRFKTYIFHHNHKFCGTYH